MPRIVPIAPAEIRPAAPAPHSKDAGDPFEQLLQATGRDDQQPDEPHTRGMESTTARAVDHDRDSARRTDRRDDGDRADRSDSKTNSSDTDSTDRVHAKEESKDDASADTGGKSKDHDKDGGKDKADASADLTAASQLAQQQPVPVDAVVAVEAAVIPASVVEGYAATGMLTPAENVSPVIDAAAAPATDAKGAAGVAAQAGLAAQAALNAEKSNGKSGAKADAAPVNIDASADSEIATTSDDKKASGAQPIQNGINAAFTAAAKVASAANSQSSAQADDKKVPSGKQTFTANTASEAVTANVKTETSGDGHDTLEGSLAKQLATDLHLASTNQIVLPDAARTLPNNLAPVNAPAQNMPAAASSPAVPLASAALAIEIASRSKDGSRQFDIRLDPPELGRIEVKLDVDKTGQVNTHLTVDRPETLDLLRRDSQGLERALQQAGLKTSDGGLEFSLRQQTPDGSFNNRNQAQANAPAGTSLLGDSEQTATIHAEQYQWAARMRGGVDIRV